MKNNDEFAPGGLDQPVDGSADRFIDEIYEIAVDPGRLDRFIDRLEAETSAATHSHDGLRQIEALSSQFKGHLSRAEIFLDRVTALSPEPSGKTVLAPFKDRAALLIDASLQITEVNARAQRAFGVDTGDPIDMLPFEADDLDELVTRLRQLLRKKSSQSVLVHLRPLGPKHSADSPTANGVLLHAGWVSVGDLTSDSIAGRHGHVLIAAVELSWPDALDQSLREVFALTDAERGVLRALVEGKPLKTIAKDRDRSVGTVRVQLKSILAKTRTRSQSEVIRITLSLMEVIKRVPGVHNLGVADPMVKSPSLPLQFEPFESLTRPDGRRMDYLVQGDPNGAPVVFSHMGYGLLRWPPSALALARQHGLKIIAPVRPGFGNSDPVSRSDDVLQIIREDTADLLTHLGVDQCPYVVQGNDMLFALDYALSNRSRVTQIIGLGARLPLPSHLQYPGMGKWHRFLLSNARHAPHLLYFTCKAAFALGRKIGREEAFMSVHKNSPADLAILDDPELVATLTESSKLALSDTHYAAFAYATELLQTESNWRDKVEAARDIPTVLVSGMQDPLNDPVTIAAYREHYPWLSIETIADAGQLLFYQKFRDLIPRIADAAHKR